MYRSVSEFLPRARRSPPAGRLALPSMCTALLAAVLACPSPAVSDTRSRFESAWPDTDFSRALVDLDEVRSGGPPRDGIPPIDEPEFVSGDEADEWLEPKEPVIVVSAGGQTRAYPLQILTWHEIVNDELGGVPLSVTFCPLCNASIVFDRRAGGRVLDFGTTGNLRKSDLVMWDRETESWWQQFTGRAIVGEMAGTVLSRLPASIVAYEDFRDRLPRGAGALPTHRAQPALRFQPLPRLRHDRRPPLPVLRSGRRTPAPHGTGAQRVGRAHRHKPLPFLRALPSSPVVNDEVAGVPVVVLSREGTLSVLDESRIADSRTVPSATAYTRHVDGRTLHFEAIDGQIMDRETGSTWNLFGTATDGPLAGSDLETIDSGVHFAFAWLAFNPDSEIWYPPD